MKSASKLLALLLAAAMLLSLAACGGGSDASPSPSPSSDTGFSPVAADKIRVGIVHITSVEDTSGYTFAHNKGFQEMAASLGLKADQIVIKDNISDTDIPATKNALQELVDADCDLIFATSYNYMDSVEEFASKYPDVIFSHCSGFKSNAVNFNNYFGRIYQARYLAGIAAGLKMKEDGKPLAGYVAAMDSQNSEVTGGINAWALGIQSVYPEAEVKVKVTGSWYDPEGEAAAAKALIDAGCYVIGQHCDTDGPQTTAQANGVFGCGYNSDMTSVAPDAHITAPIWNWGAYYTAAVKSVIDGKWTPAPYFGGMAEGLVDVSPINEAVAAPGTAAAVADAKAKIIDGSLVVFGAGITKADGTVIDKALSDGDITGGINYYIKGVSLL
ncbi:BMP family ABC transporter substrate-binding protein [Clostridia bacterium]|nr:BMP family ABC transporter substrate-binding protein [Clostridia bacterium]